MGHHVKNLLQFTNHVPSLIGYWEPSHVHQWSDLRFLSWFFLHTSGCLCIWEVGIQQYFNIQIKICMYVVLCVWCFFFGFFFILKWKQLLCILCFVSPRPKDWYPLIYDPVFDTYGQGSLVFHVGLMNGGCSFVFCFFFFFFLKSLM